MLLGKCCFKATGVCANVVNTCPGHGLSLWTFLGQCGRWSSAPVPLGSLHFRRVACLWFGHGGWERMWVGWYRLFFFSGWGRGGVDLRAFFCLFKKHTHTHMHVAPRRRMHLTIGSGTCKCHTQTHTDKRLRTIECIYFVFFTSLHGSLLCNARLVLLQCRQRQAAATVLACWVVQKYMSKSSDTEAPHTDARRFIRQNGPKQTCLHIFGVAALLVLAWCPFDVFKDQQQPKGAPSLGFSRPRAQSSRDKVVATQLQTITCIFECH